MTGQLDQLSRVIGGLEASTDNLSKLLNQHCIDDDRRHDENIKALRSIEASLAELARKAVPILPASPPDGSGYTKRIIFAAASAAALILSAIVFLITKSAEWLIAWAFAHFH